MQRLDGGIKPCEMAAESEGLELGELTELLARMPSRTSCGTWPQKAG